ncbi:MAG TPA: hypothetical protein VFH18_09025, partial [Erysipelotrichaceae bacterium]|nr:hypothetical protein [Erysipelotrichaceae bacterium]
LGVGAYPIYRKNLSIDKLVEAINFALSEPIIENSRLLSQHIESENGAKDCAHVIIKLLND